MCFYYFNNAVECCLKRCDGTLGLASEHAHAFSQVAVRGADSPCSVILILSPAPMPSGTSTSHGRISGRPLIVVRSLMRGPWLEWCSLSLKSGVQSSGMVSSTTPEQPSFGLMTEPVQFASTVLLLAQPIFTRVLVRVLVRHNLYYTAFYYLLFPPSPAVEMKYGYNDKSM